MYRRLGRVLLRSYRGSSWLLHVKASTTRRNDSTLYPSIDAPSDELPDIDANQIAISARRSDRPMPFDTLDLTVGGSCTLRVAQAPSETYSIEQALNSNLVRRQKQVDGRAPAAKEHPELSLQ